ncbi:MAG: hypothetical protein PT977_09350 [Acidobacteriota bacterium]|nr:hypothetical protein [Acidobacteriota bacterium]
MIGRIARRRVTGVGRATFALPAFLALLSPWHFPVSSDGILAFRTAAALAFEGTFTLPPAGPNQQVHGYILLPAPGGRGLVTVHAPMSALLRAAVLVGARVVPPGMPRGLASDFAINLLGLLAAAATVGPVARLLRFGGASRRTAPWIAAALLGTTFLGPLFLSDFQEPYVVFLVALALERALWARRLPPGRRAGPLLASGLAFSLCLLAKPTSLLLAPALALAVAFPRGRRRLGRDFGLLLAGAAPGIAAFLWLNLVRFGSALELGYSNTLALYGRQRVDVLWTALRLTLLPNRGLVWYAPLVLLVPFGLARAAKGSRRIEALVALLSAGAFFGVNAVWWAWEGGMGWGPRLLAPAVICLAPLLAVKGRAQVAAAVGLATAGLLVNASGYLVDTSRVYERALAANSAPAPLGPVPPVHRRPDGALERFQRPHYVPSWATWLQAPRIFFRLATHGDGADAGGKRSEIPADAALVRLLFCPRSLPASSDTGRILFESAVLTADADVPAAVHLALAAIDFGGPAVESRAFASFMLLNVGRNEEAARLCREGLALSPGREDLRRNLAVAEARLHGPG